MTGDDPQSQPLDPSLQRVRRNLLRLMITSIIITLLLVGAVLIAVIYKITRPAAPRQVVSAVSAAALQEPGAPIMSKPVDREIVLSPGARLMSQSLSGALVSLEILKPDGGIELIVYDYTTGNIAARLHIPASDVPDNQPDEEPGE